MPRWKKQKRTGEHYDADAVNSWLKLFMKYVIYMTELLNVTLAAYQL